MARSRYWRNSIRGRVTLVAALMLTAVLVVAAIGISAWTGHSLEQNVRTELRDQVNEVRLLARNQQLTPTLQAIGIRTGQVQVVDAAGDLVAASAGLASRDHLNVIAAPTGNATAEAKIDGAKLGRRSGEQFLVLARTVDTPNGQYIVYGASSLRGEDQAVRSLTIAFLAGVPLLILITSALVWRAVGRSLRPVDKMRAEVEEIGDTSLDRRVSAPHSDDEIARLATTLNTMLARLHAGSQQQRRFAADASHELRSPLASARTQLEVGLAYPDRTDWPQTAHDVLAEIDRLENLARGLLHIAKHEAGSIRRNEPLDLRELLEEQVRAQPSEPTIEYRDPHAPLPVNGDRELLVQVLRNLLTNARRHAARQITLTAAHTPDLVTVHVDNDGPGIPADQHERIFEPFTRLDDARSADDGGAGLGLAIARSIVEDHGGTLASAPVRSGARFVLTLPARTVEAAAAPRLSRSEPDAEHAHR